MSLKINAMDSLKESVIMGLIITYILAVLIIGYGLYQFIKSIKEQSKGKCSGCSCECKDCDTKVANIRNITDKADKK